MRVSSLAGLLSCPVVVVCLEPAVTQACSCATGLVYSLPAAGAVNAPINPGITLGYLGEPPQRFALSDPAGLSLNLEAQHTLSGNLHQLSLSLPTGTLLQPDTTYTVQGDSTSVFQFTTGQTVDTTRPSLAAITSLQGGYDDGYSNGGYSTCGESVQMRITYDAAADNLTPASDLLYRVYLSTSGEPELSGASVIVKGSWSLGSSLCLTTYDGLQPGDTLTVQASVIDAAGLESALTAPVSTVVEGDPDVPIGGGLGCRHTSSRPGVGALLMGCVVMGVGWGRRRRR